MVLPASRSGEELLQIRTRLRVLPIGAFGCDQNQPGASAMRPLSGGNSPIASRACAIASGNRSFTSNPMARLQSTRRDGVDSRDQDERLRAHEHLQSLLVMPLRQQDLAEIADVPTPTAGTSSITCVKRRSSSQIALGAQHIALFLSTSTSLGASEAPGSQVRRARQISVVSDEKALSTRNSRLIAASRNAQTSFGIGEPALGSSSVMLARRSAFDSLAKNRCAHEIAIPAFREKRVCARDQRFMALRLLWTVPAVRRWASGRSNLCATGPGRPFHTGRDRSGARPAGAHCP